MAKFYFVRLVFVVILLVAGWSSQAQTTYYSLVSGDWNNPEIWTLDPAAAVPSNPQSRFPGENDNVVIKTGRTITMNANNFKAKVLTVDGRLEMKKTSGHQFAQIRGTGRIILQADNFPAGDATHFTSKNQGEGTVVFTGDSYAITSTRTFFNVEVDLNAGAVLTLRENLQLNGGLDIRSGKVQFNNNTGATSYTLRTAGDVKLAAGTEFVVGTGNAVHHLFVGGSLINNGVIDFANRDQYAVANNGAAILHFEGTTDEEFVVNGRTDLYRMFLDKGSDCTYQLSVRAGHSDYFKLFGPISGGDGILPEDGPGGWERLPLVLYNGTLKLQENISILRLGANRSGTSPYEFHIPNNAGLWIDGAVVSTHDAGGTWRGITVFGKLKISAGSFTTPSGTGGITYFSNSDDPGTLEITGGEVFTTQLKQADNSGQFNFIQSGGKLWINSLSDSRDDSGVFALPQASHTFTMSGGEIIISTVNNTVNNGIEIGVGEGNANVTGGTIEVRTPTLNAGSRDGEFRINSTAPLYNLTLNAAKSGEQQVVLVNDLDVLNDYTVGEDTHFSANGHTLSVGGRLTVEGAFDVEMLRMNGSGNGGINIGSAADFTIQNLRVEKSTEFLGVILEDEEFVVTQDLEIERGNLLLNDKILTINGGISLGKGNVVSGDGRIVLAGSVTHVLNSDSEDYAMGHVELAGNAVLNSHVVFDEFTLASGIMDIGKYRMTVNHRGINGTGFGNNKMIKTGGLASDKGLNFRFSLSPVGDILYPVGVDDNGNKYTPATFAINTAKPSSSGGFAVVPVVGRHPASKDEELLGILEYVPLEFYWKTKSEGFSSINAGDISVSFRYYEDQSYGRWDVYRFQNYRLWNGDWESVGGRHEDLNSISFGSVGTKLTGDFTAATVGSVTGSNPFSSVKIFKSVRSGDWSNTTNNTRPWDRSGTPSVIDYVIIQPGHTVHIQNDGRAAAQIEIKAGGTLDIISTTGHNFADIKGDGTFRTSTESIPKADYGDFVTSEQAVFEYYGNGTLNLPADLDEYPTLKLTESGTRNAPAKDLKINKALIIDGPTFNVNGDASNGDIAVYGNLQITSGAMVLPNNNKRKLDLFGELVMSGGALRIADDGSAGVEHEINLYGALTQNDAATINLSNTAKAKLRFVGDRDLVTVNTRNDASTRFYKLEVAKSGLNKEVRFSGDFSLDAPADQLVKPLQLTRGTATLANEGLNLTLTSGGPDFKIPAEAALVVTNKARVAASGVNSGIWLDGLLKVDNGGQVLLNGGVNNYIEYAASGRAQIWVGNTNGASPATRLEVGSQIRRAGNTDAGVLSLIQDKAATEIVVGSVDAPMGSRGVLELLNGGSSLVQKEQGSVITLVRGQDNASVPAFIFDPELVDCAPNSGFVIGTGETPENSLMGLYLGKPVQQLKIDLPSNSTAELKTVAANVEGHLDIAGGTFDAKGLDLNLLGNVSVAGTFLPSANTTYFKGLGNHLISGDVTFNKVVKEGSGTWIQADDSEVTVADFLRVEAGVVNTAANQLIVQGDLLVAEGVVTKSASSSDGILLAGANTQLLQGGGRIGRLAIDNAAGVVVPTQGGGLTFDDQLKLKEGVLDIGRNLLVIGKDAEIVSGPDGFTANAMIQTNLSFTDAGIKKLLPEISSGQTLVVPIGSMGKYTPVTFNIGSNGNATGSIRVKAANEPHITIDPGNRNRVLQYNWTLDADGLEDFSADVQMQAFAAAVAGNGSEYITARLLDAEEGMWNKYTVDGFDESTYLLNFTFDHTDDAGIDGDFTAGEENAIPDKVQTFVTKANGNWNLASTWRVEGGGVVPAGGPRGAIVKIDHKVDVPENGIAAYKTIFGADGVLLTGTTFGHRLGKVSGTGRLVTHRASLPAGEYDAFFSKEGGTLEYAGTGSYDVLGELPTVNNLVLSGTGDRRLPGLNLLLNGNLFVQGAALRNESSRDINLKGDLTFDAGLFDMRAGSITFSGAAVQLVDGLSKLQGSNALYTVLVANDKGLALNKPLEVTHQMNVTKGSVFSGNESPLYISNAVSSALSVADNSFIGTVLQKQMSGGSSWSFPVGDNERKGVLRLEEVSSGGVWEVRYFDKAHALRNQMSSPLQYVSSSEYWQVGAPLNATAKLTLRWDTRSGINPAEEADLSAAHFVSDSWSALGLASMTGTSNQGVAVLDQTYSFGAQPALLTFGAEFLKDYTWTGTINSEWFTPGNWSKSIVPSGNSNVTIAVGLNKPVLEKAAQIAQTNDLSIESGATLTLNPGARLTVNGDLSIAKAGGLQIKHETGEGKMASLLTHGGISGEANVQLTLPTEQWFYLGSSIKNSTFRVFDPSQDDQAIVNVYRDRWYGIRAKHVDTPMLRLEGVTGFYINYDGASEKMLSYTGELNNGVVSRTYAEDRYQLFANPYPSYLSWEEVEGWERADFEGTMWFRTKVGDAMTFVTYNRDAIDGAKVALYPNDDYRDEAELALIAPMQSVFVRPLGTSRNLVVSNAARTHGLSNSFLKSFSRSRDGDVIRIEQDNGKGRDGAVIYFSEGSDLELDRGDSEKYFNDVKSVPEIFSRVGEVAVSINGLPTLETDALEIPLSVKHQMACEVLLSFDLSLYRQSHGVYLEDRKNGAFIDLQKNCSYNYLADEGEDHERFVLHLYKISTSIDEILQENETGSSGMIEIKQAGTKVLVSVSPELLADRKGVVELYALDGLKLGSVPAHSSRTLLMLPGKTGVYIVRAIFGSEMKSRVLMVR